MSIKIAKVLIRDVMFWDTVDNRWKAVIAEDVTNTPGTTYDLTTQDASFDLESSFSSGLEAGKSYTLKIPWKDLTIETTPATKATIIQSGSFVSATFAEDATNIVLRFLVVGVDDASPTPQEHQREGYVYQIINLTPPADHISYNAALTSGATYTPSIITHLPGLGSVMGIHPTDYFSWLLDRRNWVIELTRPDLIKVRYQPSSVTVDVKDASSVEYGEATFIIGLTGSPISPDAPGTYLISVRLIPYPGAPLATFADTYTWTVAFVSVTVATNPPLTMSTGSNIAIAFTFNEITS